MSDPTIQGTEAPTPRGIDAPRLEAWFGQHLPDVALPLHFALIPGGRSNLTFIVTDSAGTRYVLRRPPTGHLLPTAHDVAREHKIISAMGPAGVPTPSALALCLDESVTGAPFYVMGFVDGVIARSSADVEAAFDDDARGRAGHALIDTMAAIHAVDPDAAGLGDLGRKEGYIARQLKRWYSNYQAANEGHEAAPLPAMARVHARLSDAIPDQGPAAVVHGDYRLDNCILAPDGSKVLAVLDWELCTLGDPLADLGQFLVYWTEPGERSALGGDATALPGFARRAELAERYGLRTGRDLTHLDFYMAFAYWKLACILEGVYARYVGGAMGDDGFDFTVYPSTIAWLAQQSLDSCAGLSR